MTHRRNAPRSAVGTGTPTPVVSAKPPRTKGLTAHSSDVNQRTQESVKVAPPPALAAAPVLPPVVEVAPQKPVERRAMKAKASPPVEPAEVPLSRTSVAARTRRKPASDRPSTSSVEEGLRPVKPRRTRAESVPSTISVKAVSTVDALALTPLSPSDPLPLLAAEPAILPAPVVPSHPERVLATYLVRPSDDGINVLPKADVPVPPVAPSRSIVPSTLITLRATSPRVQRGQATVPTWTDGTWRHATPSEKRLARRIMFGVVGVVAIAAVWWATTSKTALPIVSQPVSIEPTRVVPGLAASHVVVAPTAHASKTVVAPRSSTDSVPVVHTSQVPSSVPAHTTVPTLIKAPLFSLPASIVTGSPTLPVAQNDETRVTIVPQVVKPVIVAERVGVASPVAVVEKPTTSGIDAMAALATTVPDKNVGSRTKHTSLTTVKPHANVPVGSTPQEKHTALNDTLSDEVVAPPSKLQRGALPFALETPSTAKNKPVLVNPTSDESKS